MKFFSNTDFINYQQFLLRSIDNTIKVLLKENKNIKAILIGTCPDGKSRFISIDPYADMSHIHHPELDYYCSLVMDLAPAEMNTLIIEVKNDRNFFDRPKKDH